jgi:hypothetical protein
MVHLKEFQTGASGDAFTFAGGTLMSGTNTISGAAVISGNINSSGTANTFSGGNVFSGTNTFSGTNIFSSDVTLNAQKDLRFADSDSSNWVAFQAPATVSSNVTWTLPAADGTSNQVLATNGSGTLSWATAGGGGGKVLQVIQAQKIDTFSTASTSYTDITGLSVTITPSSTSNKILVLVSVSVGPEGSNFAPMQIVRDATVIAYPSPTSTYDGSMNSFPANSSCISTYALNWLDSPSTTSATTYKLQMYTTGSTAYVNRRAGLDNTRTVSSLTVMEIAA